MASKPFVMVIGRYDGKPLYFKGIKDSRYVYSTTNLSQAYVFYSADEIDEVFEGDYERCDYTTGLALTTVEYYRIR